jgi:hypothetical protein
MSASTHITPEQLTAIRENAFGPPAPAAQSAPPRRKRAALTSKQCSDLIKRIETEAEGDLSDDFKFQVTEGEARDLMGRKTLDRTVALGTKLLHNLSSLSDAMLAARMIIKLRKRAAVSGSERFVVPFHCDTSSVVVNVALNDDFTGGKLLYVVWDDKEEGHSGKQSESKKGFVAERGAGDVTAHNCTSVQGVSRLVSGVRYDMYVVWGASTSVAA